MPTPLEILLWILSGIAAYGFLTGSYVKDCDYYFHNLKKNPFEKALVPFLLSKLSNDADADYGKSWARSILSMGRFTMLLGGPVSLLYCVIGYGFFIKPARLGFKMSLPVDFWGRYSKQP